MKIKFQILLIYSIILVSNLKISANSSFFLQESIDTLKCLEKTNDFLKWYKTKFVKDSLYFFTDTVKNDTDYYRVDFKGVKKYIDILKSSGFFFIRFLDNTKATFDNLDKDYASQKVRKINNVSIFDDILLYMLWNTNTQGFISSLKIKIYHVTKSYIIVELKNEDRTFYITFDQNYLIEQIQD